MDPSIAAALPRLAQHCFSHDDAALKTGPCVLRDLAVPSQPASHVSAFVRSLSHYGFLRDDDSLAIEAALAGQARRVGAGQTLVQEGDLPRHAFLIMEGWAYGCKVLANRRRQILSYFLPGDISDLNVVLLRRADYSIITLTPVRVVDLTDDLLATFCNAAHPRIAKALAVKALTASAIQREWTANLGQRTAPERIGHVLCELFYRLRAVGLTDGARCTLPLTQADLAEATGLSLVHVNKRLRDLRRLGLIALRGRMLVIPDLKALELASLFDPAYLNLREPFDTL